jgi:OOP family OmpA-OmpF porin
MKQFVLTLIAAAIAAPAFAGNAYVGGSVGRAEQILSGADYSMSDTDTGAKLVAGYQVTPAVGVEAGYVILGETVVSGNGAAVGAEPKSVYVAITGTMPLSPAASGFFTVGAAHTKTTVFASDTGYYYSVKETDTSVMAGVGVSFLINKQVSLVAEYEHFGKIAKSDGDDSLKSNLVSVGVRVQF